MNNFFKITAAALAVCAMTTAICAQSSVNGGGGVSVSANVAGTKDVKKLKFSPLRTQAYTGKAIQPAITVSDGGKTLTAGKDYTISYRNNTDIGIGYVAVTGKGGYSGTSSRGFYITPAKPNVTAAIGTDGKVTLKWASVSKAIGYKVYYRGENEKTYKREGSVLTSDSEKNSYTTKRAFDAEKGYVFKLVPVLKINGKEVNSLSADIKVSAKSSFNKVNAAAGKNVGDLAPDFTVVKSTGGNVSLSDFRGKVTVINFWATWCSPCRAELPDFQKLYNSYGKDVNVLMVDFQESNSVVDSFLKKNNLTLPYTIYKSGALAVYNGQYIPETIIIDADGVIIAKKSGSVNYNWLITNVKKAGADVK